ncbi:MAG: carboxylesterase family protein [Lachnospiraceae bacterium]|nr:carboxylesterase family protein [Lachnospiraceae bacterium]
MEYTVTTPCGPVRGTDCRLPGVAAFKGIRYATAGRFEYPKQVTHWDGTYDATAYGHCSYQPRSFYNEAEMPEKAFYYNEFRKGETYTYSEDCLFLNIWTPEEALNGSKLPVIVYIHGGGFTGGCGHEKHFDGPVWPKKGVIAVTLNYRLGPLGFICLPELKEEAGFTGNYGLCDQLTAIQWVHDNISAFGGDPDNVTIMGQSAGAMSVQQHCLSPLGDGLFHKAVMSSGAGVHKMLSAGAPEQNYAFWHTVMERCGCTTLEEFRALPVEKLFSEWKLAKKEVKGGMRAVSPVLDGRLIVGTGVDLLAAGKQKQISYMAGATSEDVMPPIIYSMAKDWCQAQSKASYAWFFDRKLPGDKHGAWHSSDLWYWFGTLKNCWRPMEKKDYDLSEQMSDYLTNFAKYGDPNGTAHAAWQPMSAKQDKVLRFGEGDTRMGKASKLKLIYTMLTNKAVGE